MSWDWVSLLAVGGVAAALFAAFAAAAQREAGRARLARVELEQLRPRLRRAGEDRVAGQAGRRP